MPDPLPSQALAMRVGSQQYFPARPGSVDSAPRILGRLGNAFERLGGRTAGRAPKVRERADVVRAHFSRRIANRGFRIDDVDGTGHDFLDLHGRLPWLLRAWVKEVMTGGRPGFRAAANISAPVRPIIALPRRV